MGVSVACDLWINTKFNIVMVKLTRVMLKLNFNEVAWGNLSGHVGEHLFMHVNVTHCNLIYHDVLDQCNFS